MAEQVLLDNDVALKVACYSLVNATVSITTVDETQPAMLGVARFVIRGRLNRSARIADVPRAKVEFERLVDAVILLEPDEEELALAADLEAKASQRDLELDSGESQLLAILARRACRILVTGDKRAIAAMALIASELAANRIGCLEQLMTALVKVVGVDVVRPLVCREARVDRAITSCFACASSAVTTEEVLVGLVSYIDHLDRSAPGVLVCGFDALVSEIRLS